jgi:hypothetical protein
MAHVLAGLVSRMLKSGYNYVHRAIEFYEAKIPTSTTTANQKTGRRSPYATHSYYESSQLGFWRVARRPGISDVSAMGYRERLTFDADG